MGSFGNVFKIIDVLSDEFIGVWESFCNIESPTNNKSAVDTANNYLADLAKKRGWLVERFEQPISGDVVVITMNPSTGAAPVCLSGHTDTVHPIGSFGTPAVRRDEKNIYGPGVTDCKGGIIAAFLAMDALCKAGFTSRPVMLLLQTDEEGGSKGSNKATINYICERAQGAVCFLNLEGNEGDFACIQRKGIASYTFKISGIAAHGSLCAISGANAIAEAAHKILELEKFKDHTGITCTCSLISGGTTLNTVPDGCEFSVNFRYATQEQNEYIKDYVNALAKKTFIEGCTTTLKHIGYRHPMELKQKNVDLLNRINEIWATQGLSEFAPSGGTGGSDAADVTVSGVACVDCLGVYGEHIHTRNEYARISSLPEMAKRLASIIYYI